MLHLTRAFFEQFFGSDTPAADATRMQRAAWTMAFLLAPGLFLMIELFPEFQFAVTSATAGRTPAGYVDDLRAWVAFLFTTYSMVAMGFVTVLAWEALSFERRDAMVLGPLPLRPRTILSAKLGALVALLVAGALPITLSNAAAFALETAGPSGLIGFARYFVAIFAATFGAASFGFLLVVSARGAVAFAGGSRFASACGPPLQFLCIVGLLCLVIFCPFVLHVRFASAAFTNAMPSAWFVGVFELLRGSPRAFDPQFPFLLLARRAAIAIPAAAAAAFTLSVVEFRRHMRFTLAPPAGPGLLGRALVSRGCARLVAGRDAAARATADFILLTLARHRGRQTTVAVYSAVAATIAIAGLSQGTPDLSALMRPRTAVLWVPLLVAYWMTLGLRASFLVPGETGAAWTFRFHSPSDVVWSAARAAIIGFVVPRALLVTALLVPLVGWRVAGRHAIAVAALTVLLSELVALTVRDIPFTRRTVIEQAKLNIRWAVYLPGMFFFAYVPVRLALAPGAPVTDSSLVAFVVGLVAGLEIVGRYRRRRRSDPLDETGDEDDEPRIAVLGLAGVTGS